jgi:hypothetical protein
MRLAKGVDAEILAIAGGDSSLIYGLVPFDEHCPNESI